MAGDATKNDQGATGDGSYNSAYYTGPTRI